MKKFWKRESGFFGLREVVWGRVVGSGRVTCSQLLAWPIAQLSAVSQSVGRGGLIFESGIAISGVSDETERAANFERRGSATLTLGNLGRWSVCAKLHNFYFPENNNDPGPRKSLFLSPHAKGAR